MYTESSTQLPEAKVSPRTQLIVFFVLSFVIGWLAWSPLIFNPMAPQPLSIVGLFAPAISATIVAWWSTGRAGVARIYRRFTIWRFSPLWYLLALLLMPLIYTLAFVYFLFINHSPIGKLFFDNSPLFLIIAYVYLMVINSGEEIGWRGFALPLLQRSLRNPLLASLLLGAIWGLWHYPLYMNPAVATMPFPVFLLLTIGLSVVYMYLFNLSKGSLWPVLMIHAATDWLPRLVNLTRVNLQFWFAVTALVWLSALILALCLRNPIVPQAVEETPVKELESAQP